jgi:hypothetical protein
MGHAAKNIGGIYENPKTVEQPGSVYEFVPEAIQKEAMDFLHKNLFTTPEWLINESVISRTGTNALSTISLRQETVLNQLTSSNTFSKLIRAEAALGNKAYTVAELITELKQNIWSELATHKPIDLYRRNLQKAFIERMGSLVNPTSVGSGISFGTIVINFGSSFDTKKSDVVSIVKGNLRALRSEIKSTLPSINDTMTTYHLQDVVDRITLILEPR